VNRRAVIATIIACTVTALIVSGVVDAATRSTTLTAGNSLTVTCPNALSNANVAAKSETVKCATKATTTTTASTTTTTTTPATGSKCTKPVLTSSDPEFTDNTDPVRQFYWVNNDAWSGTHGPQTLQVCRQSSWNAVSNQPNNGGQVETYPDTEYDVGARASSGPGVKSTTPISTFGSATSTFAESYPSAGSWDAGYDLWTNNWKNETMIWNQWAGSQAFWPEQATTHLTLGGVPYTFYPNGSNCKTTNIGNCELLFFRQTPTTSGSVDLLAAFRWEVTNGYAKASDVPTQLEYGVEIASTSGTETFPMTGLTFSVQPSA
jgi:hypothetical protein